MGIFVFKIIVYYEQDDDVLIVVEKMCVDSCYSKNVVSFFNNIY